MKTVPYWLDGDGATSLPPLDRGATADAVVIGGGIAGLTVAQLLSARGLEVVVLERDRCGSGATGRSSGFITPDSELQVSQLVRRFGVDDARRLWLAASAACDHIAETIDHDDIRCDRIEADSVYIAADRTARSTVKSEHDARGEAGLPSLFYEKERVPSLLNASGFDAAVRYEGTFAITAHRYAVELRDRLLAQRVRVFERTPVQSVDEGKVIAPQGAVTASMVFFCADHDLAAIGNARPDASYVQTFLGATAPIDRAVLERLFPDGDFMVWDTDLVYHYFRRTADDRLLIGGGSLRNTYGPPHDGTAGAEDLQRYLRDRLPLAGDVPLTHAWSGLIGVTKDFLPIAGRDRDHPRHFYAGCGAGIPWSVLAAQCAVEAACGTSDLERFFAPHRAFTDVDPLQSVLPKQAAFAFAHGYTKAALRGTAEAVKRRRPYLLIGLLAALGSLLLALLNAFRDEER